MRPSHHAQARSRGQPTEVPPPTWYTCAITWVRTGAVDLIVTKSPTATIRQAIRHLRRDLPRISGHRIDLWIDSNEEDQVAVRELVFDSDPEGKCERGLPAPGERGRSTTHHQAAAQNCDNRRNCGDRPDRDA
jgi:hypothetical protein